MTQTKNSLVTSKYVGTYGTFQALSYALDFLKISTNNELVVKTYKSQGDGDKNIELSKKFKKIGYKLIISYGFDLYLIHERNNSLLNIGMMNIVHYYNGKFKEVNFTHKILSTNENLMLNDDNVYFLVANNYGMEKIPLTLPKFELSEDNYNINFSIKDIIEKLAADKSGLMIFEGDPGTGKSYLIKHLVKTVKKDFIFITQDMIHYLFEPKNMSFVLKNLKNNILIFEDSENLFIDRKQQVNQTISTILNLCDGIMGDLFGIKIIATINIKENIDSALLRKGRLLAEVDFKKLSVEASNNLLKKMGSDKTVTEECTLAELYNINDQNGHQDKKPKRIGFGLK